MESIIPTNEYTEFEGRAYLNPQVGIDESNKFIDNLRATQTQQNQEIANQTRMLGTDVPSVQGGLIGPESYFTSRYSTPQTNAVVSNLRSAAQAAALNQALQNEQAIWKKRYQDAYNNYQKRAWNRGNPSGGGSGGGNKGLELDTNENNGNKKNLSEYTGGEYRSGKLYPVTDYVSDYQDASGQWWQVSNPTSLDISFGPARNQFQSNEVNEKVVTVNGKDYMYLDTVPNQSPAWYPVVRSAGPQTYSPYAGS